jgi:hypothetical protein
MAEAEAPLAGPAAQAVEAEAQPAVPAMAEAQPTGSVAAAVRLERGAHRKKLAEIFYNETWWLCTNPCSCGGYGCVSPSTAPMCMSHDKHCCIENLCQSEPWDEGGMGVCFDISKMCCIVNHSSCPPGGGPNDGVPLCACCGQRCGGESGEDVMLQEDAQLMKDTFLLYYCLCMGCGLAHCSEPFCKANRKCCCVRSACYTTDACPSDRDCIYSHSKFFCCINACTCLPFGGKRDGLPACACFGNVIFGAPASPEESQPFAPPAQEAMVAAP